MGYVLERLIGAMTVQQKMDVISVQQGAAETMSPNGNEEEHGRKENAKSMDEVNLFCSTHR